MTEFKRGLKAGIVSGIIWGVIACTIGVLQAKIFLEEKMSGFGYEMPLMAEQMFWQFVVMAYPLFIIGGIILGIIVGLIYAAVYNSLPSSKSIIKGIVLLLIFWLIFVGIGFFLTMIGSGKGIEGIESSYIESMAINLIVLVIFGILLGLFWDKFGVIPKEIPKTTIIKTIKCPSCGETTQVQGGIGTRVTVICPKCNTKGVFQFR